MTFKMEADDASVVSDSEEIHSSAKPARDEVHEIEKANKNDTNWIKAWRSLLILTLGATAASVTLVSYRFLKEEQSDAYKDSFEKFSETIGAAALEQQRNIVDGFESFANILTASAQSAGAVWPYYTLPLYESYARHAIEQTGAEIMVVNNIVPKNERESYEAWTSENFYPALSESYMIKNGNLDSLPDNSTFVPQITRASADGNIPDIERELYFAVWSWSPPPFSYGVLNWNPASLTDYDEVLNAALTLKHDTVFTKVRPYATAGVSMSQEQHDALHSSREGSKSDHPHSFVWHPVHEKVEDFESPIVAVIGAGIAWDVSLRNLLPQTVSGIFAVISNSCNQSYTYFLDGPDALYFGEGDMHDRGFDGEGVAYDLALGTNPGFRTTSGHCLYELTVYPSSEFAASFDKTTPEVFAGVVAAAFLAVGVIFVLYDIFVQRRNRKVIATAAKSSAIVTQLFPGKLRDKVMATQGETTKFSRGSAKANIKSFVSGKNEGMGMGDGSKPLAELFLETTVMFGDIVGFTAWSSTREPTQVFSLLEAIFKRFDEIAHKRGVFKVETVGDCYVAAVGIPEYRRDHAVVMMRFARDILYAMDSVTRGLEVSLGPDTADLRLRIGVHSGPVTAGVLRGERARFQLFGDTMNVTARLESAGKPGHVHLSTETADLLKQAGKGSWLIPRDDRIQAKGLGELQTYWLQAQSKRSDHQSVGSCESTNSAPDVAPTLESGADENADWKERTDRLISWNTETLLALLKQVVARRNAMAQAGKLGKSTSEKEMQEMAQYDGKISDCLSEVREIIALPEYDHAVASLQNKNEATLSSEVKGQLRAYVSCISSMYQDNHFHNFEHASHVMMSVTKLMSRIVAPSDFEDHADDALHDHTYGITSDPLTQFSCAFSALIHDADHEGVPNATLVQEKTPIASAYNFRSVAEQNSLDLSWGLLMDDQFRKLRQAICETKEEFQRFRQLVVNSVMATDIADKDLKKLRNARWERAFSESKQSTETNEMGTVNRKATIVIEHLIQASDVSHTMQHWHIYRKWNERLFGEMLAAFNGGRSNKHPAEFWYKGEIGFFDFYVIPLAKKLKECGVFGVSSGEYLDYALRNRREWEERGQQVVAEMMAKVAK